MTLVQIGLLLLLLTAAAPPLRSPATLERTFKIRRGLEVLPFVPMLACVAVTFEALVKGNGIPERQILPAMLMAAALIVRQYSTSRERQQLVGELRQRELNLEAELAATRSPASPTGCR